MTGVLGIHHVTAIAGDPQRNLDFWAGVLGLRLVKRTVNFDDPGTYHFYFGDEAGAPGSLMTFFPWPRAHRGRQGAGQVAVTSFAVVPEAIGFWIERLLHHGVRVEGPRARGNGEHAERVLSFQDPDGLLVEIVGHRSAESRTGWSGGKGIAQAQSLRGVHAVTLWVEQGEETEQVLVDALGLRPLYEEETTKRYAVGDGGSGALVDVRAVGGFLRGADGVGSVHHVAWRAADAAAQHTLRERVIEHELRPTPVLDRHYFQSVYFREPGGVLFELATDGPGFAIDEPVERLGERLMLPPRMEPNRGSIEASLPAVHFSHVVATDDSDDSDDSDHAGYFGDGGEMTDARSLDFVHRFEPVPEGREGALTLLLLHGTGGDENDLITLGRALHPGAALLSPRGRVLERGMPRFFRRHAEGVLDLEDLAVRTGELARFVDDAASVYGFRRDAVVAVGFSNGANIAASLLLRGATPLRAAVLLAPMLPFEPNPLPDLRGAAVFIGAGRFDPLVPATQTERLAELLRAAGADVTEHWEDAGHTITQAEVAAAAAFVRELATDR